MRTINAEIKHMIIFNAIRFLRIIVIMTTNTILSHPDGKERNHNTHTYTHAHFLSELTRYILK